MRPLTLAEPFSSKKLTASTLTETCVIFEPVVSKPFLTMESRKRPAPSTTTTMKTASTTTPRNDFFITTIIHLE